MSDEWQKRLLFASEAYWKMTRTIIDALDSMSDEELLQLRDDTKRPTQTNCWYASFEVAPVLRKKIDRLRLQRERFANHAEVAAERARSAPVSS